MKTKISTLILTFASLILLSCTQPSNNDKSTAELKIENYIVLTNNIQQIRAISNAAQIMKSESAEEFGKMEVMVCGKTVSEMTNEETMEPLLKAIEEGELDVKACGFSLKQFNIDSTDLPSQISVVENGIYYNFKKQHEGYNSLGL